MKYHLFGINREGKYVELGFAYGTKAHASSRLSGARRPHNLVKAEAWLHRTEGNDIIETCAVRKEWK